MPSSTRSTRPTAAQKKVAKAVADAIAARPFDPSHGSALPAYAAQPEEVRRGIAQAVAEAKAAGASGDDLRERFGGARDGGKSGGLTGPMRRKVLREFGFDSRRTIAPSYNEYSDGDARVGSARSAEHGPKAAERQAAAQAEVQAQAEAQAKADARKAKAAARRKARKQAA